MDKIIEKLEESAVFDWQKPGFSKIERANIIVDYMRRKAFTLTQMAKKLNVPKTTLFGWLLFGKMSEAEYNKLLKDGFSQTDIFNKLKDRDSENEKIDPWDYHLNKCLDHLNKAIVAMPETVNKETGNTLSKIGSLVSTTRTRTFIK